MKITKSQLKQIIKEEVSKIFDETQNVEIAEEKIDEGFENITPENPGLVADVVQKFVQQPEVLALVTGGAGVALVNQLAALIKGRDSKRPPGGGLGGPGKGPISLQDLSPEEQERIKRGAKEYFDKQ